MDLSDGLPASNAIMSGQIAWGRFALFSTAIIGVGWAIMAGTTPNEEQFYNQLAPDLKRKVDEIRAQRASSAEVREKLLESAKDDKIVWGNSQDEWANKGPRKV